MITIGELVNEYLRNHPFVEQAMEDELINYSSLARQILVLATRTQRETNPIPGSDSTRLPTLRDVFYSVEFHEREIFEMFGVFFEGHPDNRRLLLPEDWADLPPLRKDFAIKGR